MCGWVGGLHWWVKVGKYSWQYLAEAKVIYGNTNYINQVMDAYSKVTKEDIQRVAKTYMDLTGRVVLYYLPKSAQPVTE